MLSDANANYTTSTKRSFIFIVGNGRSGTTLMARIISNHPAVAKLKESHFIEQHLQKGFSTANESEIKHLISRIIKMYNRGIYNFRDDIRYPENENQIFNRLGLRYKNPSTFDVFRETLLFIAEQKGKNIAGDQTPNHIFYLEQILRFMPDAKFVLMIRDARDVLLSQKRKWKACKRKGQPFFEILRTWANYHPLTYSFLWNRGIKAGLMAVASYPEHVLEVRFEKLVKDPEPVVRSVCKFLKLEFFNEMLQVGVSMSSNVIDNHSQGISPDIMGKWQKGLDEGEKWIVTIICGNYLQKLGYKVQPLGLPPIKILIHLITLLPKLAFATMFNLPRQANPFAILKRFRRKATR